MPSDPFAEFLKRRGLGVMVRVDESAPSLDAVSRRVAALTEDLAAFIPEQEPEHAAE